MDYIINTNGRAQKKEYINTNTQNSPLARKRSSNSRQSTNSYLLPIPPQLQQVQAMPRQTINKRTTTGPRIISGLRPTMLNNSNTTRVQGRFVTTSGPQTVYKRTTAGPRILSSSRPAMLPKLTGNSKKNTTR